MPTSPSLLIAAGLDPSGGAGLLADVQVAQHFGCRATGVVTASTVQNSQGVLDVVAQSPDHMAAQVQCLALDTELAGVKIGMLPGVAHAKVLGTFLSARTLPVVWDPVLRPTRGLNFFEGFVSEAIAALAPVVTLVTPNIAELSELSGVVATNLDEVLAGARALLASGFSVVLIKGGHLDPESSTVLDVLVDHTGHQCFEAPRVAGANIHGTGCALSTAIASCLCRGDTLAESSRKGIDFVRERIAKSVSTGHPSIC